MKRFGPFVNVKDDGRIVCTAGSVNAEDARLAARALIDAAAYVEGLTEREKTDDTKEG